MKNITLSADEKLIEAARARARAEHTTLNELFRQWLEAYAILHGVAGQADVPFPLEQRSPQPLPLLLLPARPHLVQDVRGRHRARPPGIERRVGDHGL